jgi:ribosomal protein S3
LAAEQPEKRIAFRRAMRGCLATGKTDKIQVSGRLNEKACSK